jgi:hypothetical protein
VIATSTANAITRTSRLPVLPSDAEKNSDSSKIAEKSATVAATIAVCPTVLSDCPASLSTGTIRPSEVADSAIASSNGLRTQPAACRPKPIGMPSARVIR